MHVLMDMHMPGHTHGIQRVSLGTSCLLPLRVQFHVVRHNGKHLCPMSNLPGPHSIFDYTKLSEGILPKEERSDIFEIYKLYFMFICHL